MKNIILDWSKGFKYLFIVLPFHKGMEIGIQSSNWARRFDIHFQLNFAGQDHAGLKFHIQLWYWFFEFSISDNRHWNYNENHWCRENES